MAGSRIVFAILAHKDLELLADLVDSLRHYEPGCSVVLFNGGSDNGFGPASGLDVCRYSMPIRWGQNLQNFQLGVMRQLHEDGTDYDYLVSLDSDQLLIAPGLSARLDELMTEAWWMGAFFTRCTALHHWWPGRRLRREWWLWKRFIATDDPWGCYNPGQVFRREYVEAVAALPRRDQFLSHLARSRPWIAEEVIFPSLAVSFGRARGWPERQSMALWSAHTPAEVQAAADSGEVHLMHRVEMDLDSPERVLARSLRTGESVDLAALQRAFVPRQDSNHPPDRTPFTWRPPQQWVPRVLSRLSRTARLVQRARQLRYEDPASAAGSWGLDVPILGRWEQLPSPH